MRLQAPTAEHFLLTECKECARVGRVVAVKAQRILVHGPRSGYGNSAICSNPAVSGNPNIRFMFWIA